MVSVEFVPVGNAGNANDEPDSNGLEFGQVNYNYNIAKYETTYGQYVEFLNAVAKSDPYGLFNPGMQDDKLLNGIARTGTDGNYNYRLLDSASTNKPVTYVNFLDGIRFANWMNNGQGNASTESGAYSITTAELVGAARWQNIITYKAKGDVDLLVGDQAQMTGLTGRGFEARSTILSVYKRGEFTFFTIENKNANGVATGSGTLTAIHATHDSGAKYWITTENEWYKAAYYNPTLNNGEGGYYDWATQSDSTPGNTLGNTSNQANIRTSTRFTNSEFFPKPDPLIGPNMLTEVGSFTNSASYYGTFDQDGNVTEWNDSIYDPSAQFGEYNGSVNGTRVKRGASFYNSDPGTAARDDGLMPNDAGYAAGFRLASASDLSSASNPVSVNSKEATIPSTSSNAQASSSGESDTDENHTLIYSGVLSSANELWPTLTPATGTIKLTLNEAHTEATYELNIIGLDFGKWYDGQPRTSDPGDDVAGMHFHHAPFYTVGDVCIGLINPNQENDLCFSYNQDTTMWTLRGKWTDSDRSDISLQDSLQYIYAGELYTNIHTERVALGEIRAQFSPQNDSPTSHLLDAIAPYTGSDCCHSDDHSIDASQDHEHPCEETFSQPSCDCCLNTQAHGVDGCENITPDQILKSSSQYQQEDGTDFVIDLSSVSAISAKAQASRSATYDTDVFFYRVADAQGSVVDQVTGSWIRPDESGYAAAVQASKVSDLKLSRQDGESASESLLLQSDGYLLGLVATVASTGNTFYSFSDANDDGYNHFKYLSPNKVGFEDLFGGGDRDHNDLTIDLTFVA